MNKLLSTAALLVAISPLAQAQVTINQNLGDHPDARNDRPVETRSDAMTTKHHHRIAKHQHHQRHHHTHTHSAK
jgi:hypothetical protein